MRPFAVAALCAVLAAGACRAEEPAPVPRTLPLKDPGFENIAVKGNLYGAWTFAGNYGGGPQKNPAVTGEAAAGASALRIRTGYIRQDLPLAEGDRGRTITISFSAKGCGEIQCFLSYPGVPMQWKDIQDFFPLTDEFMPYSFTMKVPEKAAAVSANIGFTGLSFAVVDDVSLVVGAPAAAAQAAAEPALPAGLRTVNIAPFAAVRTKPYATMAWRMTDGVMGTGAMLERCAGGKTEIYEFVYPKPQEIVRLRWSLPSGAYVLAADCDGDGRYERRLALVSGEKPVSHWGRREWPWAEKVFQPPLKACAVKLTNFHKRNATVFEFEIHAPERAAAALRPREERPAAGVAELVRGETVVVAPPPAEKQYLKGVHIEAWMWNSAGRLALNPRPPLAEYPYFRKMLADIKGLNANLVWLFPPRTWEEKTGPDGKKRGGHSSDTMWPSRWARDSHPDNLLKEFCDAMHREGIRVYTQLRGIPLRPPTEDEKAAFAPVVSRFYRDAFAGICAEQVACGVDGVALCEDEDYCRTANPAGVTDQRVKDAFLKESGLAEFPKGLDDTEAVRRWHLFWYRRYAEALKEAGAAVRKAGPSAKTITNIIAEGVYNSRLDWGVCYDIVGHTADIDYFGTDPYFTLEENDLGHFRPAAAVKRLSGANRARGTIVTLNCPWADGKKNHPLFYETFPPVAMAGQVLSSVMHGGTVSTYYRLQEYLFYEGYDDAVRRVFSMLDTLAAWGMKEAVVPSDIVVLHSRAGDDWWQLKKRFEPEVDVYDTIRGAVYEKAVMELLFSEGYPFRFFYQDQPETLPDLSRSRVVILPFPYSLDRRTYAALEKAAAAGTRILVFDRKGETDEYGTPYPEPLLAGLIASGKAVFVPDDIAREGLPPARRAALCRTLDGLLGGPRPLTLRRYGRDVEAACLEKGPREKFLMLINWTGAPTTVDAGLALPPGSYRAVLRDMAGARSASLGGRTVLDEKALASFRVGLAAGEMLVIHVTPGG